MKIIVTALSYVYFYKLINYGLFFLLSRLPVLRVEEIADSFINLTIRLIQNIQFGAF